jgi:hypothetical protein
MSLSLKGATRRSLFWSLQLKGNQKKEYVGTQCPGFSSALVGSFLYRRFGTTYYSHLLRSSIASPFGLLHPSQVPFRCLILEEGTDRLSRNVGQQLPINTAEKPRRANTSTTSWRKHADSHVDTTMLHEQQLNGYDSCNAHERRVVLKETEW